MNAPNEGRIPPGYYRGRALAGSEQFAINPDNGNEQIAIDLEIPSLGRMLTTFLYFSDRAAPYAIERLRALGWAGDDVTRLEGIDRNEVDVQIKYELYKGEEKLKVEISTGGGRVKLENVMDERQKRAFSARMKALLAGSAITAARQQPAASAPPPRRREGAYDHGPPADDDIPF